MASRIEFLQLLRRISVNPARTYLSSCRGLSRTSSYVGDYKQVCVWARRAFQTSISSAASVHYHSSRGVKLICGSICSLPVGFALISDQPTVSLAMNAFDIILEDRSGVASGAPEARRNTNPQQALVKKMWRPLLTLLLAVLLNLYSPFSLVTTVSTLFLCTNPRPSSIYLEIDKLKREYKLQEPLVTLNPLYARRVDVENYIVASIARVQIKEDEFTCIGVLGTWWLIRSEEVSFLPKSLPVCWNILWSW